MEKKKMTEQANLAFEFIEKLYAEISYLIKETEGFLKREDEEFVIGRPGGYRITAGSSLGLDYPDWWSLKKLSVFFVPKEYTETREGATTTKFKQGLKVIFFLVALLDKNISTPKVAVGTIYNLNLVGDSYKKFELAAIHFLNHVWDLARNHPNFSEGKYEDNYIKFKGKFIIKDLFDINNTQEIQKKLLGPVLKQYRSI